METIHWFDDPAVVRQLPLRYRLYARYCRATVDRVTGIIPRRRRLLRYLSRLTLALHLRREARVRVGGTTVFVDLLDPRMPLVLAEVRGVDHESDVMRALLGRGDTFLDVGANHGSYSIVASKLVGETGRVIAFEPQSRLAALARRSLEANGASDYELHELACGDREGTGDLYVPDHSSGSGGLHRAFSASRPHTTSQVRIAPLDCVLERGSLRGNVLVKLDVEGSELPFVRGARQMIATHRPAILLELNPQAAQAAGYSLDDLLGELGELGYERLAEVDRYPETVSLNEADRSRQRNVVVLPEAPGEG